MIQIVTPHRPDMILPFYLAVEEWVAMRLPEDDYFFAWQVEPTVICGRHQIMPLEVDMDFCRANNIKVWRRKSGGGCVYADRHNIMFSYITSTHYVANTFARYTSMVCEMLHSLGLEAHPTGRNDIEINAMKVAGNAFYSKHGRSIVHGTMLYDADFPTMASALTPSRAKLSSKGVKSVPSRVTTLRAQGLGMECDDFVTYALKYLCSDGKYTLSDADLSEVHEIMQTYLDPAFMRSQESGIPTRRVRVDGAGELCYNIDADGKIDAESIHGDFFADESSINLIKTRLHGRSATTTDLIKALEGIDVSEYITGLSTTSLIQALTLNE